MNIAVMNNNAKNKFWDRLLGDFGKKVCKVIFLFPLKSGMSNVASNQIESPTAKVEGRRPRTTANLNPCLQIEKIQKFRLII